MKILNAKFLKKFLSDAANELDGDWILIGGTLLPAVGIDHRVTTDIDLVSLSGRKSARANLQLMSLAEINLLPFFCWS